MNTNREAVAMQILLFNPLSVEQALFCENANVGDLIKVIIKLLVTVEIIFLLSF